MNINYLMKDLENVINYNKKNNIIKRRRKRLCKFISMKPWPDFCRDFSRW